MKKISILLSCLLLGACGSHEQSVSYFAPEQEIVVAGETDPTLRLINAVNAGDIDEARSAVDDGANLATLTNDGLPLLLVAVIAEQYAMIDFLIASKIDVDLVSEHEEKAKGLTVSEYLDSEETENMDEAAKQVITILLDEESGGVVPDDLLQKIVFDAVESRNVDLVQWILTKGLDPNVTKGRNSLLMFVFKRAENPDSDGFEKVKELFEIMVATAGIDINLKLKRHTALSKAKTLVTRKKKPHYQHFVDRLLALGATE